MRAANKKQGEMSDAVAVQDRVPAKGEVWRHTRFAHLIRVEDCVDDLVRFHTLKTEQDRRARRYSTERRVRVDDFCRIYHYDAAEQSSDD